MNLTSILDKARDVRSIDKMKEDIEINTELGKKAMKGLCEYISLMKQFVAYYEYFDEKLWNTNSKIEYKQDADLTYKGNKFPIEVKVTRFSFPERIFVRKSSIDKLGVNGYLYLSEDEIFCILKKSDIEEYKIEQVPEWGNKKCYILEKSKLEWIKHINKVF